MPTLHLKTSIKAHGEEVSKLEIRAPNGKDLRLFGSPFQMTPNRETGEALPRFDNDASARLLTELAGVPLSSIDQMSASDFLAAQMVLLGFFGAGTPTTS